MNYILKLFVLTGILINLNCFSLMASYTFTIQGNATFESSFGPAANKIVKAHTNSYNYTDSVKTDSLGLFTLSFVIDPDTSIVFYIYSNNDCDTSNFQLIDSINSFDGTHIANFLVCEQGSENCNAFFTYNKVSDNTVDFIDHSTGEIIEWNWSFGDGNFSNEINPVHIYENSGIYNVELEITTIDSSTCYYNEFISIEIQKYISGIVYAGDNLLPNGRIFGYITDTNINNFSPLLNTSFSIDSGYFHIPYEFNIPYTLYAIPELNMPEFHTPEYFPTYSGNSLKWNNASKIQPEPETLHSIQLLKQDSIFYGHGNILGTMDPGYFDGNEPEQTCILLLDTDFTPIKYTFLSHGFDFSFHHLPYKSYYLLADKIGFDSKPHFISIKQQKATINVHFSITDTSITSIPEYGYIEISNPFPNPCKNQTTIPIKNKGNKEFTISIINALGQKIHSVQTNQTAYYELNTSTLKPGTYFIKVKNKVFKVIKVE